MGNRIIKIVKPRRLSNSTKQEEWTYTYYVRDATGNILATYTRTFENDGDDFIDNFTVSEWDMYGSSRIGVRKPIGDESLYSRGFSATYSGLNLVISSYGMAPASFYCTDGCLLTRTLGKKEFEFTNHLGNVLETVSDIRLPIGTASSHTVDYYTSDVLSYTDYYVFGSTQSNRAGGDYRYDFNGKETDDETSTQDYGMRIYNAALGKFLSVDPVTANYPELTPYQFASDIPVWGVDIDGRELSICTSSSEQFTVCLIRLARMYTTKQGQSTLNFLNQPGNAENKMIWIGDYERSSWDQTGNILQLDEDYSFFTLVHELDHMERDLRREAGGIYEPRENSFAERDALYTENYYRTCFGIYSFRLSYYDFFKNIDIEVPNNPNAYNRAGESSQAKSVKWAPGTLEKINANSGSFGSYTFAFSAYSADAPEIVNSTSGMIMFYDYKDSYVSPMKNMAVKVEIYKDGQIVK